MYAAYGAEEDPMDFFAEATESLEQNLRWIEQQGQKNSPNWHLVNGMLRLAQGLRLDHEAEEDRRRSFARSCSSRK